MTKILVVVVPWDEHEPITTADVDTDNRMRDLEALCGGPVDLVRIASRLPDHEPDAAMLYHRLAILGTDGPNFRATQYMRDRDIYPNTLPYWLGPVVFVGMNPHGIFLPCPVTSVAGLVAVVVS